jgi:hypothetical protein
MKKTKQIEYIKYYMKTCKYMSNEELKGFHYFAGHDCFTSDNVEENIEAKISYDCACVEMNKRGLYMFDKLDGNILDRVNGLYDYNNI